MRKYSLALYGKKRIVGDMEHELRAKLISTAERCTRLTEMSEAAIGLKAVNDNTILKRIRSGAGFTVRTYDRLIGFMEVQISRCTLEAQQ